MVTKRRAQEELLSLFLRRVKKTDLPKRDPKPYKRALKARRMLEAKIAKHEQQLEKISWPLHKAQIESLGLSADQLKSIAREEAEEQEQFRAKVGAAYREQMWSEAVPAAVSPQHIGSLVDLNCTEIVVRVCKDKVCVDQALPLSVDDIWAEQGSDCTLNKDTSNRFSAQDSVAGSSSWNLFYHRHGQTHEGQINIWSSGELVEPATVHGLGVVFKHTVGPNGQPEWNGAAVHGNYTFGLPPSWGRGKMHWEIKLKYKEPGGGWTHWFDSATVKYFDTGQVESNIMWWSDNVLGEWSRKDLSVMRFRQFPAGTQFLIETYLSYWIKALGEEGSASVHYNLDVKPYVKIEACSYQYPEWVTVHVPDYLP